MKATGIVRRLDDLGRLVIPKEIRKQYRLKEGDSIEFYIDNDRIVIQKYDVLSKHVEEIKIMCETLHAMYQNTVLFIHDDWKTVLNGELREEFIERSRIHRARMFEKERVFTNNEMLYSGIIHPVTAFGDWYGAFVIVYDKKALDKEALSALEGFAQLLSRQQQQ